MEGLVRFFIKSQRGRKREEAKEKRCSSERNDRRVPVRSALSQRAGLFAWPGFSVMTTVRRSSAHTGGRCLGRTERTLWLAQARSNMPARNDMMHQKRGYSRWRQREMGKRDKVGNPKDNNKRSWKAKRSCDQPPPFIQLRPPSAEQNRTATV